MLRNGFSIFFLLFTAYLGAQVKFVNEFLNIGVGARAQGMSGSVVANVADPTAAYWNPSALVKMDAPLAVSAMHANWFGDIANYDHVTIAKRLGGGRSYGAFTLIRMGIDNIPNTLNIVNPDGTIDFSKVRTFSAADYGFLLSYGTKIGSSDNFSVGGNVKIIRRIVGEFSSAWGFGGDLSATYKMNKFTFGTTIRDITTTFNSWSFNFNEKEKEVFLKTGNDVPISSTETALPRLITGLAYKTNFSNSFSLLAEVDASVSTNGLKSGLIASKNLSLDPSFGAELGVANLVFLRFGVGNLQRILNDVNANQRVLDFQPNVGLGISLGRLKIDYALANVGNVSGVLSSHIFSLNLNFAPRKVEKQTTEIQL
jgi:hypothetical protein